MKAYKGGKSGNNKKGADPNLLRVIEQIEKEEGRKITVNDSEIKYSEMLINLIQPFQSELPPNADEVEALLSLATIAWNLANMKKMMPHIYSAMISETKKGFGSNKDSARIVEKLISEKEKKYDQHDMFIHRADLNMSPEGEFFITATAKPFEAFMAEGLDFDDDDDDDDFDDDDLNFMPAYINRNAFTVIPKKPFLDWIQNFEGNLFPIETDNSIYLIEEKITNKEVETWLKKNFDRIFKKELERWHSDEKQWPKKRTYQMFNDWFDISYQSMVYDLEDFPVEKDME